MHSYIFRHVYIFLKCPRILLWKSPSSAPKKLNSDTRYFKLLSLVPAVPLLGLCPQLLPAFAGMPLGSSGRAAWTQAAYKDNGYVCTSVPQRPVQAQWHQASPPLPDPLLHHHPAHLHTPPTTSAPLRTSAVAAKHSSELVEFKWLPGQLN